MKYLVTCKVEFYQWLEADSEEDVRAYVKNQPNGQWLQTMNQPIQNVQVKQMEIDTTGSEVK